ncbi:MAG: hypothetical protein IJY86_12710 [Clostridia bacterium]|nr:hypothetical protein [Clostridia bacterium]MBQ8899312.1 hypothetical protein [Clostridia bacterium]
MKKTLLSLVLALAALFCFCACGTGEEPQAETTSPLTENRLSYSYPPDYDPSVPYPTARAVQDSAELYAAVEKAFPDRPVLAIVRAGVTSQVYPIELLNALNLWLEENGYGFAVSVYTFGLSGLSQGLTFSDSLGEFFAAGGKCDLVVTGLNVSSLSGLPSDTVHDFIGGGMISPLTGLSEADLGKISALYGEDYVTLHTFGGKCYGFSPVNLTALQTKPYYLVHNSVLPLLDSPTAEELNKKLLGDEGFLSKAAAAAGTQLGLSFGNYAAPDMLIEMLCFDGSYAKANYLPVFVSAEKANAPVTFLWEADNYLPAVELLRNNANIGLTDFGNTSYSPGDGAIIVASASADLESARAELSEMLSSLDPQGGYTLLETSAPGTAIGPESALFLSATASDPTFASRFIVEAMTDGDLALALYLGPKGFAYYTEENGDTVSAYGLGQTAVIFTSMFQTHLPDQSEDSIALRKAAQQSYSYAPCHNFNADFSLCPDGANALSEWNRAYLNASQHLQDDLLDTYGESLGNFISTPTPELSEMKALIEAQLEAHLKEN